MKNFALLFRELDETTQLNIKVKALVNYFKNVPPGDAAWVISLLLVQKFKQVVPLKKLKIWASELANIPEWLFTECLENSGDLAETISLILPFDDKTDNLPLQIWIEKSILPLISQKEEIQKERIISAWYDLNSTGRYLLNKLITGTFRLDITTNLVIKAIASFSGVNEMVVSQRLLGIWEPSAAFFNMLCSHDEMEALTNSPYPFNLSVPLNQEIEELGDINQWLLEWNINGLRSQIIKRNNKIFIWSISGDLLNDHLPELCELNACLPNGTVMDGIIIPVKNNQQLPSIKLKKRISNKYPTFRILSDIPVSFVVFDLLQYNNNDIRSEPLALRSARLIEILNNINESRIIVSPFVKLNSWDELKSAKTNLGIFSTSGLIIKNINSSYTSNWYKWKNNPITILAVLLYARIKQGSFSPYFNEYTFALWHEGNLVPFAKTFSGLNNDEIIKVDSFIRNNTLEKFGPVRTVKPELVFEIEFDQIERSTRHKSGIVVISPRIASWHPNKKIHEIGSLNTLLSLIRAPSHII